MGLIILPEHVKEPDELESERLHRQLAEAGMPLEMGVYPCYCCGIPHKSGKPSFTCPSCVAKLRAQYAEDQKAGKPVGNREGEWGVVARGCGPTA